MLWCDSWAVDGLSEAATAGWRDGGGACDMRSHMDWRITIGIAAALGVVAAFAGWRGARPPDLTRGPRLMPWRAIMLLAAAGALLTAGHAVSLLKGG